jgi:hypothetical protein
MTDCSKCPKLQVESQKVSDHVKQIEILEGRLKLCRAVMRQNDIGHLYPGTTKEYEENMRRSIESGGVELTEALYVTNKFNQLKNSQEIQGLREHLKKLLQFIEYKGITAKVLSDFIRKDDEALRNRLISS